MNNRCRAGFLFAGILICILLILLYLASFPHKRIKAPSFDISGLKAVHYIDDNADWQNNKDYEDVINQYGYPIYEFENRLYYVNKYVVEELKEESGEYENISKTDLYDQFSLSPDTLFTGTDLLAYAVYTGPKTCYYVYYAYIPETEYEYIVELADNGTNSLFFSDTMLVLKRID